MSTFIKGLGLDLFDFKDKVISVVEEGHSESSFCISSLVREGLSSEGTGVCLVALHHSLRHYGHQGMRLGHNLARSLGTTFQAIDPIHIREAHLSSGKELPFSPPLLLSLIQQRIAVLKEHCTNIFLVIDCISDFLNLGVTVQDILLFIQYLIVSYKDNNTIVICTQCHDEDEDQMTIKNTLLYSADLRLSIKSLETGFSKEVTGSIELTRVDPDSLEGWSVPQLYHYKTKDRNINVFLPGNISFSY